MDFLLEISFKMYSKIRTPKSCINDEFGMTAKKINVKSKISTCLIEKHKNPQKQYTQSYEY